MFNASVYLVDRHVEAGDGDRTAVTGPAGALTYVELLERVRRIASGLRDLGVRTMRLLTNNPAKRAALEGYGLAVLERVPLPSRPQPENLRYLRTKRDRMGHLLDGLDLVGPGPAEQGLTRPETAGVERVPAQAPVPETAEV